MSRLGPNWLYSGRLLITDCITEDLTDRLKARWGWNGITRVVVGAMALGIWGMSGEWRTATLVDSVFRGWLIPAVVILSSLTMFFYVRWAGDVSTTKLNLARSEIYPRVFEHHELTYAFEFFDLAFNFIFLFFLVAFTGGIRSMFLPLYVIGLVLSDISLEMPARRNAMMVVCFASLSLAVLVPHFTGWAVAVYGSGGDNGPAFWNIGSTAQLVWVLVIFITGSFFGSKVLREHLGENGAKTS